MEVCGGEGRAVMEDETGLGAIQLNVVPDVHMIMDNNRKTSDNN